MSNVGIFTITLLACATALVLVRWIGHRCMREKFEEQKKAMTDFQNQVKETLKKILDNVSKN